MAKQNPTARPGRPMSRNSLSVPRQPSRQTMKQSRNAAAQTERQNTTVQLSSTLMKRAMVPPKLHISADRNTSRKPIRSSRCGAGAATRVGDDAVSVMGATVELLWTGRCARDDRKVPCSRNAKAKARGEPETGDNCGTLPRRHWKSKALKPVTISSRPSGRVTGGSARARQPTRSQSRQAGPTGVAATLPAFAVVAVPGSAAP